LYGAHEAFAVNPGSEELHRMAYARRSIFALAWLPSLLASGCITINIPSGQIEPLVETVIDGEGDAKVLMLEVEGVISDSSDVADFFGTVNEGMVGRVREELERARTDDHVKALVLRINSPGGTVTGSDLLYNEIRRFKQERRVPVVAQLMGTAASGGYYVALAADEIHAERTTVTGSIGVIFSGVNIAGLMEKFGVENQTITSGRFKDAGSMLRRMRPEERAQLQSVIDDLYVRFVEVVKTGRAKLTVEQIRALADGRIYSATQAKSAGLVDEIGSLDDSLRRARELAGLANARIVTYHRPREYTNNYYTRATHHSDALFDLRPRELSLQGPAFLYLWAPGLGLRLQ
jgi:protease IV